MPAREAAVRIIPHLQQTNVINLDNVLSVIDIVSAGMDLVRELARCNEERPETQQDFDRAGLLLPHLIKRVSSLFGLVTSQPR